MLEVRYKQKKGDVTSTTNYTTVNSWGKDNTFLQFSRKGTAEFIIIPKDRIIHLKYMKDEQP